MRKRFLGNHPRAEMIEVFKSGYGNTPGSQIIIGRPQHKHLDVLKQLLSMEYVGCYKRYKGHRRNKNIKAHILNYERKYGIGNMG